MQRRLAADGITRIGQLAALEARDLAARYGRIGVRLAHLSRGEDDRRVDPDGETKSISAETTFAQDEADGGALAHVLWPLCEKLSGRLKEAHLAAATVTLKLKTADFRLRTRSHTLADPTQLADILFEAASSLLRGEADGVTRFRLIGVGADRLVDAAEADLPTLFDATTGGPRRLAEAIDALRQRHGAQAVQRGRALPVPMGRSVAPRPDRDEGPSQADVDPEP